MTDEATDVVTEERKRGFPSPLTILTLVMVLVWVAAFFIPSGQYDLNEKGQPIPSSFHEIDRPLDTPSENLQNLLLAPVNGLYGIQDLETGQVGPFNTGALFGLAQVFLFILAIGGFMTVVFATGALDLGIAHLAHRFQKSGFVLIIALSLLFGVLGSVMSWSDETLGFYALLVPLMLALRYDRIVAVAVVTVAPFVGIIGSTINPFRIGVGSDAAGISLADGLGLRVVIFVLVMAAMIVYTLRYAARVSADPAASIVGIDAADAAIAAEGASNDLAPLTARHKAIIALVAFTFLLLTFSIIPWAAIFENELVNPETHETITKPFWFELGWWLPELSVLFVVMAIVIGVVAKLGEARFTRAFIQGVVDFTGPAILVTVARGISVILTNTKTIDTVLNSMEELVSGRSDALFIIVLTVVTLPLGFLVGAGAAGNALVMPILAPLGDFAGIDRSLVVTTYNAVGGWLALVLPTNAILVAGLALGKVGINTYVKFMLPLMGILIVLIVAVLLVGVAL